MKTTITSNIEGHYSDEEQHNFMLLVSCLGLMCMLIVVVLLIFIRV